MKRPIFGPLPALLFFMLAGAGYPLTVFADAADDCRQEARDYEIPAEQLDDYVNGCLASRGELNPEVGLNPEVELNPETDIRLDFTPPPEPEAMAGDTNAAQ